MSELVELARKQLAAAADVEDRLAVAGELAARISPVMEWFILAKTGGSALATEEILEKALVAIATGLAKCDLASDASLMSWCKSIARRRVADYYRKKRLPIAQLTEEQLKDHIETTQDPHVVDPSQAAIYSDAIAMLGRLMQPCQGLLLEHFVEGFSIGELAEKAGITYDAARMRINHCLTKARQMLTNRKA